MIDVNNLKYSISNKGNILEDVNFQVSYGEYIGVLGHNGAGKTTLLDLLMGFRKPTVGNISIFGQDPQKSNREFLKNISYLSQDANLKDNITLENFFKFNSFFYDNYSYEIQEKLMTVFKLDYHAKIGSLSTGQKRRVQIIATLANRSKLLLVDEITAVLDPDARYIFFELLNEMNQDQHTTIMLATNITEDLKGRVKKVLFIKDHKLYEYEPSNIDSLFQSETV